MGQREQSRGGILREENLLYIGVLNSNYHVQKICCLVVPHEQAILPLLYPLVVLANAANSAQTVLAQHHRNPPGVVLPHDKLRINSRFERDIVLCRFRAGTDINTKSMM